VPSTLSARAVLLDAGNTLVCLDFVAISKILKAEGVPVTPEQLGEAEYHGRRAVNAWTLADRSSTDRSRASVYFNAIFAGAGIHESDQAKAFQAVRAHNSRECLWRVVPEGTHDALADLKRRSMVVGVVSNSDGRVEELLSAAGLAPLLEFIIDSHIVGVEKPDARIFHMGLESARAAAPEAVYVGDLYAIDILGARDAGIAGVLVDRLWREEVDCPRVRTVAELPALLL
jgi:FMN phosphatase YigB (HAD superfamily)